MTFRAASRAWQWTLWLCGALVALLAYVLVARATLGRVGFDLLDPRYYRIALSAVALFSVFAWETRWDGVRRVNVGGKKEEERSKEAKTRGEGERSAAFGPAACGGARALPAGRPVVLATREHTLSDACSRVASTTEEGDRRSSAHDSDSAGEALYAQARAIPHQSIPDFDFDGPYLELLGKSAAAGHAPAMAKFGAYAMRRAAWVEAYYWMSMAKRRGMQNLDEVLRTIRRNWGADGFPCQVSNVNKIFTEEAGSIGRALLHVDSGRNAPSAREYLKSHCPELAAT